MMTDPITLGAVGTGIVAAAPIMAKAIKGAAKLIHDRLNEIEDKLHSDHLANSAKVQAIQDDITDIKVDVAVVKTEVANMKDRA
jgi:hypothetical protein